MSYETRTDALGQFALPSVTLDYNNASAKFDLNTVSASPAGYDRASLTGISVPTCGSDVVVELALPKLPGPNFGAVQGRVLDSMTGLPIAQATVQFAGVLDNPIVLTDDQGRYSISQVVGGTGGQTSTQGQLSAYMSGYYGEGNTATVIINANQTLTTELRLTRIRYGRISGIVIDGASRQPLRGAILAFQVQKTTGPDGTFLSDPIATRFPGVPTVPLSDLAGRRQLGE